MSYFNDHDTGYLPLLTPQSSMCKWRPAVLTHISHFTNSVTIRRLWIRCRRQSLFPSVGDEVAGAVFLQVWCLPSACPYLPPAMSIIHLPGGICIYTQHNGCLPYTVEALGMSYSQKTLRLQSAGNLRISQPSICE